VSGLGSWSNPDQTVGVSLFGSYQKRNFTNISAPVQAGTSRRSPNSKLKAER
jgi:hypothetical protein